MFRRWRTRPSWRSWPARPEPEPDTPNPRGRVSVGDGARFRHHPSGSGAILLNRVLRGLVCAVLPSLVLAACAQTVERPPAATVVNHSGKAIVELRQRRCGAVDEAWQVVADSSIGAGYGTTYMFQLADDCADLDAFYGDGKLAGSQRGVIRRFPFRWVIY
jgi:hypothetical protein